MTSRSRRLRTGAGVLAAALALAVAPARAGTDAAGAGEQATRESPAIERIQQLHEALLGAMRRAEELGFEGRVRELRPVIERTFDLNFMAEKATGRTWSELDPQQRERMVRVFERMTVATYAARFDGYDGQRFEVLGNRSSIAGTRLVHTHLLPGGGRDPIQLTYRLHETDASWQVIDVFLKGTVSELAMRRSEYAAVIRREGFDALIAALEEKVRKLETGEADAEPGLEPAS